jgi:hypothetical protein
MGRLLRRFVLLLLLAALAFHGAALLGMVYLRFFPPLVTSVQLQRQVEGWFGAGPAGRVYDYRPREEISIHRCRAAIAAEDTRSSNTGASTGSVSASNGRGVARGGSREAARRSRSSWSRTSS